MPLTTAFTPPTACLETTTYDGLGYYLAVTHTGYGDGAPTPDATCYPSSFSENATYSPGICPSGWIIAVTASSQPTNGATAALCCPLGYGFFFDVNACTKGFPATLTNVITINAFGGSSGTSPPTDVVNPTVPGPAWVWATGITIEWKATDSAILPLETTYNGVKITLPNPTLSGGAIAGIALAAVAVLALLGAFFLYRHRSQRKHSQKGTKQKHNQSTNAELDAEKTERPGDPGGIEVHTLDILQHTPQDTLRGELPTNARGPEAELDVFPAQALADSTPLVELDHGISQPVDNETSPRRTHGVPAEADSVGILELPQSESGRSQAVLASVVATARLNAYELDAVTSLTEATSPIGPNKGPEGHMIPSAGAGGPLQVADIGKTSDCGSGLHTVEKELRVLREEEERIMAERARLERFQELDQQAAEVRRKIKEKEKLAMKIS
jgi:hypothetical protein